MSAVLITSAVVMIMLIGLPTATLIRRERAPIERVLFEAAGIGLVWLIVMGILALRTDRFSLPFIGVTTLLYMVVTGTLALRRRGFRRIVAVDVVSASLLFVVVPAAVFARMGPIYFAFQTGDMGEYVNSANVVADGGALVQGFPHGFTVLLAFSSLVFGEGHTVIIVPALGILFLIGIAALLRGMSTHLAALGIVVGLVAFLPVPVWFSLFPVSEILFAVLLIAALSFLLDALQSASNASATAAGIVAGVTLLVRGNGLILISLIALVAIAAAIWSSDTERHLQRDFAIATVVTGTFGWWYSVAFPREYFVDRQLREFLPDPIFRVAEALGLLEPSPQLLLLLGLVITLAVLLLLSGRRTEQGSEEWSSRRRWNLAITAATALSAGVIWIVGSNGVSDGLLRWGVPLVALLFIGLAVALFGRQHPAIPASWLVLVLLIFLSSTVLHAVRIPQPKSHAYYLYWDRYLFSEAFPAALLIVGVGLTWTVGILARRFSLAAAVVAISTLLGLGSMSGFRDTYEIATHRLFGDPYTLLKDFDRATTLGGSQPPVIYFGSAEPPTGWFFPNTYRAFALPLHQTFGREVLGMPTDPFGRDPLPTPDEAQRLFKEAEAHSGFVIALRSQGGGEWSPTLDKFGIVYIASIEYTSMLIGRSIDWRAPARFREVTLVFDVFRVSA